MCQVINFTFSLQTKADLEEISQAEADVTNLKQKVDDLCLQLNQQRDQNYGFTHDSNNQLVLSSNQARW